ncbi:ParB/RepB/Spo0J family partition protein [Martelella mediterranea]|uniref:ParB family chromosome partitioning protein n=1 Tax=Martelella mediterranea TaxID=293089 RepID=A0A4R3NRF2_9HYPH|nr:ParB N-terminal domain-containing protein [Martelella mediterranea]TCT37667.1 ParB family chromosome partitioning protein [Martelella mediterranea]
MTMQIGEFELPIDQIEIPDDRARNLDEDWSRALGQLIATSGLTNAITVRKTDDGYRLVTGLHRVDAHRLIGLANIRARLSDATNDDEARLEEVMENLGRNELNALDRCHHLYELKQAYERLYPETKAGTAGALARHGSANEIFSFATDVAEKIGLSTRAIQIAVKIWKDLTQASRIRLAGTAIAEKQSELKLLSAQAGPLQKKILDHILSEDNGAKSVQEALDYLNNGVAVAPIEKKFLTISRTISALPDETFDRLVLANEDRVLASLKRRGRI